MFFECNNNPVLLISTICVTVKTVMGALTQTQMKVLLDKHNYYRNHLPGKDYFNKTSKEFGYADNMRLMKWSKVLADVAQVWANHCVFKHGIDKTHPSYWRAVLVLRGTKFGQNIYWTSEINARNSEVAIDSWYQQEVKYYNWKLHSCISKNVDSKAMCGHMKQVLWQTSEYVGCGSASCTNGTFVICQYFPKGNNPGLMPFKFNSSSQRCEENYTKDCEYEHLCQSTKCKPECLQKGGEQCMNALKASRFCIPSSSKFLRDLLECPKLCGACRIGDKHNCTKFDEECKSMGKVDCETLILKYEGCNKICKKCSTAQRKYSELKTFWMKIGVNLTDHSLTKNDIYSGSRQCAQTCI